MTIFSPGFRVPFGGNGLAVSGGVILCLEIIGGLAGIAETGDGCFTFPAAILSAAGRASVLSVISTLGFFNLRIVASAG